MATTRSYINFKSVRTTWHEGLLILMYHSLSTPPLRHGYRGLYVEPSKFRSQLEELQRNGVPFTSLTETLRETGMKRQAVVTFDDGYEDVLLGGLPILRELNIPAINYIVADRIGETNAWDRHLNVRPGRLMTQDQIHEWLQAGHEIGSHTLTHPHLKSTSPAKARREIFDSKNKLEDLFERPILHFCYPYGDWNESLRDLVAEAGYETACTTDSGYNLNSHPLSRDRIIATHRSPYAVALWKTLLTPFMSS